jgi:hypothetical protein
MAPRRLTLTTRGVIAVCLAPLSAVAGLLLGAEELVLVSIALGSLLVSAVAQGTYRARRARGNWRISVDLAGNDAEVDSPLAMTVALALCGRRGDGPLWLEDPQHCWERAPRPGGAAALLRPRMPNPSVVLRAPIVESGVGVGVGVGAGADAGASTQLHFLAPTESRGVFNLRGMRLWCFDSFGLVAQLVAVGPSATITVHPVPLEVELGDDLLRGEQGTEDNHPIVRVTQPRRDSFGDFAGLRPYVPGDRLRLLYWPALARSGELLVRDFEDDGPHRVHVVADVRALIGEAGAESVLATVAGVGLLVLAQGSVLELSTTSGERMAIGPGPFAAIAFLRAIAGIETVVASVAPPWWAFRRHVVASASASREDERELHPAAGTPLVVTTEAGVRALPASFGLSDVVVAP